MIGEQESEARTISKIDIFVLRVHANLVLVGIECLHFKTRHTIRDTSL